MSSVDNFSVLFLGGLLKSLLRLVDLEVAGSVVQVDSFVIKRPENGPADIIRKLSGGGSRVGHQKIQSIRWSEARIEMIARLLVKVLSFTDLVSEKKIVKVDGFRLKDLKHWQVYENNRGDFFPFLRSGCRLSCVFCYQDGTHPSLKDLKPVISEKEVYTRLKYYEPAHKAALFDQRFFELNETMTHPHFLQVLRKFREKERGKLMFLTNGVTLTEHMIRELALLQPIGVRVSLNSADKAVRRKIMRDKHPEIAMASLPLLKAYQIPFAVSIVALPSLPPGDLENTVGYASEHDAQYVVIHVPGHSAYINPKTEARSDDGRVVDLVNTVRRIRSAIETPVTFLSDLFERHVMMEPKLPVVVKGIVKNSAAAKVGLKMGDRILEINGTRVEAGRQLIGALSLSLKLGLTETSLRIQRDDKVFDIHFHRGLFVEQYPYYPAFCPIESRYGVEGMIIDREGLDADVFRRIGNIIDSYRARQCLVLTTVLMKSLFDEWLQIRPVFSEETVRIETAIPKGSFWGGNIYTGDHFVVTDFVECIREWVERKGYRPDVIIIPASPFSWACGWMRDITGKPYLEIERRTGVPVELV